jgi:hypothetical protein
LMDINAPCFASLPLTCMPLVIVYLHPHLPACFALSAQSSRLALPTSPCSRSASHPLRLSSAQLTTNAQP